MLRRRNAGLPSLVDFYPLSGHLNFGMLLGSVINSLLLPYLPTSQVILFNVFLVNIKYRQKTPKCTLQFWTSTWSQSNATAHSASLTHRYFSVLYKWTCHKLNFWFPHLAPPQEILLPCDFLFWWITVLSFNLFNSNLLESPLILFPTFILGASVNPICSFKIYQQFSHFSPCLIVSHWFSFNHL